MSMPVPPPTKSSCRISSSIACANRSWVPSRPSASTGTSGKQCSPRTRAVHSSSERAFRTARSTPSASSPSPHSYSHSHHSPTSGHPAPSSAPKKRGRTPASLSSGGTALARRSRQLPVEPSSGTRPMHASREPSRRLSSTPGSPSSRSPRRSLATSRRIWWSSSSMKAGSPLSSPVASGSTLTVQRSPASMSHSTSATTLAHSTQLSLNLAMESVALVAPASSFPPASSPAYTVYDASTSDVEKARS
mmetsp:Transcript_8314/g.33663  ORF Transcript_8314/g.33663 Transcript_8314/m.33663 type:complete len:248 (-) Transcript_8314:321-1064(-)